MLQMINTIDGKLINDAVSMNCCPSLVMIFGLSATYNFFWFLSILNLFKPYPSCCLHSAHIDDDHGSQDLLHFSDILWNLVESLECISISRQAALEEWNPPIILKGIYWGY